MKIFHRFKKKKKPLLKLQLDSVVLTLERMELSCGCFKYRFKTNTNPNKEIVDSEGAVFKKGHSEVILEKLDKCWYFTLKVLPSRTVSKTEQWFQEQLVISYHSLSQLLPCISHC